MEHVAQGLNIQYPSSLQDGAEVLLKRVPYTDYPDYASYRKDDCGNNVRVANNWKEIMQHFEDNQQMNSQERGNYIYENFTVQA